MSSKEKISSKFLQLIDIMKRLRSPGGCPWDKEQNFHSLKPYVIEEAYEVLEALENNDKELLQEELGDLLLQIVFLSQLAYEHKNFSIEDVLDGINSKLIRRHPHVFEDLKLKNSSEVLKNWNAIKHSEKKNRLKSNDETPTQLGNYPVDLPILHKVSRVTDKAAKLGFDWPHVDSIFEKVDEEISELKVEIKNKNQEKIENEFGDLLFTIVNLARRLKINPDIALRSTLKKFMKRFKYIEECVEKSNKTFQDFDIETLEKFWNEAKNKI